MLYLLIVDSVQKSLRSPLRSPNLQARSAPEEPNMELQPEIEEIEFEESLKYYEYSRDHVKAYWHLPVKKMQNPEDTTHRVKNDEIDKWNK